MLPFQLPSPPCSTTPDSPWTHFDLTLDSFLQPIQVPQLTSIYPETRIPKSHPQNINYNLSSAKSLNLTMPCQDPPMATPLDSVYLPGGVHHSVALSLPSNSRHRGSRSSNRHHLQQVTTHPTPLRPSLR